MVKVSFIDGLSYEHQDILSELNGLSSLTEKLRIIHRAVKSRINFIDRIAIVLYDTKTGLLKTFTDSGSNDHPLTNYTIPLSQVPSLQDVVKLKRPRILNNLKMFGNDQQKHTQKIKAYGYAASYTMPMYLNGEFSGLIFFNSYQQNCFVGTVLMDLDLFGHLIASVVVNEMAAIRNLLAALKTANEMVHLRDPETGAHLDRMSRFSRLIAEGLVANDKYDFNDEFIEYIFLFSPMHDIGKIGIPDNILLKPGRLNPDEFEVMKTHASKGRQMVDSMVKCFGLETLRSINVLRNITECHHESLDGSGYPHGLKGQQIPIEARIIAVADIFDALASPRPYKRPWNNEDAFALLKQMQTIKLDPDCVMVLVNNIERVKEIQQKFHD